MNDLTPATGLTEKQEAFVSAYVATLGKVGLSARRAGYTAPNEGTRLLQNPKVVDEIRRRVQADMTLHGISAIGVTRKLMKTARSDYVKLEAAKQLIALSPFQPPAKSLIALAGDLQVSFDITQGGLKNDE